MIEINDATLTYPSADKPSLVGVSLSVPRGQAVLVCGRSGCGKTSLTRLINGLAVHFDEAVLEGSVAVSGLDATRSPSTSWPQK